MASNYRFYKQTLLGRVKNMLIKAFALFACFAIMRTYADGGSVFEFVKFYSIDFLMEVFFILTQGT